MVSRTRRQSTTELRAQCVKLRAALVDLVGADSPAEWDRLELKIRLAPPSQVGAQERALLNALAVLRETESNQAEHERSGDEDAEYYWSRW